MDSINNACKLGSDAWLELQAFKTRQLNRREKLNRHKDLINGITHNPSLQVFSSGSSHVNSPGTSKFNHTNQGSYSANDNIRSPSKPSTDSSEELAYRLGPKSDGLLSEFSNRSDAPNQEKEMSPNEGCANYNSEFDQVLINLDLVECLLLLKLCDVALKLPIDSKSLQCSINKIKGLENTPRSLIENLLQKFAHQELITIEEPSNAVFRHPKSQIRNRDSGICDVQDDEACIYVTSADHTKLVEFDKSFGSLDNIRSLLLESKNDESITDDCADKQSNSVPIQSIQNQRKLTETSIIPGKNDHIDSRSTSDTQKHAGKSLEYETVNNSKNSGLASSTQLSSHSKSNNRQPSADDDLESLLSLSSTRERESKKLGEELLELLSKPTAKERNVLESFRSADGYQVQEFCPKGTKGECRKHHKDSIACDKLHFKKIIAKHTDESLGDCSFLNTCFHMDTCKYVHYEVDYDENNTRSSVFKRPYQEETSAGSSKRVSQGSTIDDAMKNVSKSSNVTVKDSNNNNNKPKPSLPAKKPPSQLAITQKLVSNQSERQNIDIKGSKRFKTVLYPPQWIQCDLRFFDMSLLGKFSVVMADPPWDIHMELPYGTMSDDEMRKLNIPALQDDGVIFLWVTGRAMELGRECLALWGYERCDEIIWVKTNQLQRIIRTGRTGHWLNHGKEHCLVGVKGNPKDMNLGLDCDVIVAEVRATSHKPDEIYGIIERLSPGTRKIELFGRAHNVQPNWITLGNQLNGVCLIEPNLMNAFQSGTNK